MAAATVLNESDTATTRTPIARLSDAEQRRLHALLSKAIADPDPPHNASQRPVASASRRSKPVPPRARHR